MRERQCSGVQAESRSRRSRVAVGVELIAENRVTKREHVDTQLVTPTCVGREANSGPCETIFVGATRKHFVVGATWFAFCLVHDLPGAAKRLLPKRNIDGAAITGEMSGHQCLVGLVDGARFECHRQRAVRVCVARKHDHARGVAVESMHNARAREIALQSRHQAVGLLGADSRHRQEPRRLVADHEERV